MIVGREILPGDSPEWNPPAGVRLQVPVVFDGDPRLTLGVAWVYVSECRLVADIEMLDPEHETYDLHLAVTGEVLESVTRVPGGEPRPTKVRLKAVLVHMTAPSREGD